MTQEGLFHMFSLELVRFWPPLGHRGHSLAGFVRKSTNASKLRSLVFPVDCPRAEPAYQSYRQGQIKMVEKLLAERRLLSTQSLKTF